MDNAQNQPQATDPSGSAAPALAPRPFSTPHSAPVEWLAAGAAPPEQASPPVLSEVETQSAEGQRRPTDPSPRQTPTLPATRHDGWTGDRMADFCETLAETAVVIEACDVAGMSVRGAYAARRRDPIFAAAWDAALTIARERLADTLLARAMEGNVEQIWRDGKVVGERHVLDNRLGLALLRRLDRLAETGLAVSNIGQRNLTTLHPAPTPASACPEQSRGVRPERSQGTQYLRPEPIDWQLAVESLRAGDDAEVAAALALIPRDEGDEVHEVHTSPDPSNGEGDECVEIDCRERFWRDEGEWWTNFPAPDGFTGREDGEYGDDDDPYQRQCAPEEAALMDADEARDRDDDRAEDAELRDLWFALLRDAAEEEQSEGEADEDEGGEEEKDAAEPEEAATDASNSSLSRSDGEGDQ